MLSQPIPPAPTDGRVRAAQKKPVLVNCWTPRWIYLWRKALPLTRVEEVAKRAGVQSTLFLYFVSKEELFKAVVRETSVRFAECVHRMTPSKAKGRLVAHLHDLMVERLVPPRPGHLLLW